MKLAVIAALLATSSAVTLSTNPDTAAKVDIDNYKESSVTAAKV